MEMFNTINQSAKELAKNPLGIIALFILLVYGFACLLFGVSVKELASNERMPIIYFTIGFPVLVLGVFSWLVSKHHNKLYAPSDYRDDESFLRTINQTKQNKEPINENIDVLMRIGENYQMVKDQEERIIKDLKDRNINSDENKITILIRNLAAEQIKVWVENIYFSIFGSQIELLKLLELSKAYNFKFFDSYFNNVKERYREAFKTWDTETYLDFLISYELIEKKDEDFFITIKGTEFIKIYHELHSEDEPKGL